MRNRIRFMQLIVALLILFECINIAYKKNREELHKEALKKQFEYGYKQGVLSSNTALKCTKDLTKRDKAIYWATLYSQSRRLGIELK